MIINHHPGLFIAFEGIDGSGKSVQVDFIAKSLADVYKIRSGHILKIHEPTTGHFGRAIKRMLTHKDKIPDNPLWFQELFVQDRKDNLSYNIIPHLRINGNVVLSDRYILSTFAYGMAQGLKYEDIERLHKEILGDDFIYPDITFVIDTDPDVALMRLQKRESARPLEYFEVKREIMAETAKNYRWLADRFPNTHLISGDRPIGDVSEKIFKIIAQEKKLKGGPASTD